MRRKAFLLLFLMVVPLACSPGATGATGEGSAPPSPSRQSSEHRCGDGVCDGPENAQNCPQDCAAGEKAATGTSSPSRGRAGTPPPWFASDSNCTMTNTWARSEGSPWAFDSEGNSTGLLPEGQTTCLLEIHICDDTIFKQQVIGPNENECPESLAPSHAPQIPVCCAQWNEAKRTGLPCNPLDDADCDGVPNATDAYPLDFSRP